MNLGLCEGREWVGTMEICKKKKKKTSETDFIKNKIHRNMLMLLSALYCRQMTKTGSCRGLNNISNPYKSNGYSLIYKYKKETHTATASFPVKFTIVAKILIVITSLFVKRVDYSKQICLAQPFSLNVSAALK